MPDTTSQITRKKNAMTQVEALIRTKRPNSARLAAIDLEPHMDEDVKLLYLVADLADLTVPLASVNNNP